MSWYNFIVAFYVVYQPQFAKYATIILRDLALNRLNFSLRTCYSTDFATPRNCVHMTPMHRKIENCYLKWQAPWSGRAGAPSIFKTTYRFTVGPLTIDTEPRRQNYDRHRRKFRGGSCSKKRRVMKTFYGTNNAAVMSDLW
jgi:hypothetical protein